MKTFKFFWNTHKWAGIILALVFTNIAITGTLLLVKKQFAWIQPPTMRGEAGGVETFITNQQLFAAIFAEGHPDFTGLADIDRIDFQPRRSLFKVVSLHHNAELQICAVTGKVLSVDVRRSDLIEQIHDGQFFAPWFHQWVMPVVACGLLFMVFSGLWMWVEPMVRRKKRRESGARRAKASAAAKVEASAG